MEPTGRQESSEGLARTTTVVWITHVRVWTTTPFAEVIRRLKAETDVSDPSPHPEDNAPPQFRS